MNGNPAWNRRDLVSRLSSLLEIERLILIPTEPGDAIGHADGVVRFTSRDVVVVNDYRSLDREYGREIQRRMSRAKLKGIAFPYLPARQVRHSIPSAVGNYVNFLRVDFLVVIPTFGIDADVDAREILMEAFHGHVAELNCRDLAAEGGVLNCCTWSVKGTSSSRK